MSTSSTSDTSHVARTSRQISIGNNPETVSSKPSHRPNLQSFSGSLSDPLNLPERAHRKVSFSEYVITSSRVEKQPKLSESPNQFYEQVSVAEHRCPSPIEDTGPSIIVQLVQSEDDVICNTPLANAVLPVFEVRLGMLKQATVYHVQFTVPDSLPPGEVEILRYSDESGSHTGVPMDIGANCNLISCDSVKSGTGHNLILQLSTTKRPRVREFYTMRLVEKPSEAVHLILHGFSLGRGQGTPFLRLGIHRISENPDFDDSDEYTEWPGFVNRTDEEEEEEEEEDEQHELRLFHNLESDNPTATDMDADQGDQPGAFNHPSSSSN